jgi:hypothetical protein
MTHHCIIVGTYICAKQKEKKEHHIKYNKKLETHKYTLIKNHGFNKNSTFQMRTGLSSCLKQEASEERICDMPPHQKILLGLGEIN